MTRCVYLVGGPGVGKSALMDKLTESYQRVALTSNVATRPRREWLYRQGSFSNSGKWGRPAAVELGARATRHPVGFPGTDALPMNAVVDVESWISSGAAAAEAPLILGEGARLGVKRFVNALMDASIDLHVVLVVADSAERRRTNRGSTQRPAWVKGAFTRAARIHEYAESLSPLVHAHTLRNDGALSRSVGMLRELTEL